DHVVASGAAALGVARAADVAAEEVERQDKRLRVGAQGAVRDVAAVHTARVGASPAGATMDIAGAVVADVEVAALAVDGCPEAVAADVPLPLHRACRGAAEVDGADHVVLSTADRPRRGARGEGRRGGAAPDIGAVEL